jgi:hypothetical protein
MRFVATAAVGPGTVAANADDMEPVGIATARTARAPTQRLT